MAFRYSSWGWAWLTNPGDATCEGYGCISAGRLPPGTGLPPIATVGAGVGIAP